jgi:hypothetical protein
LNFSGFRTNGWYGKKEAPGYLIIDNQIVLTVLVFVIFSRRFYHTMARQTMDYTKNNPLFLKSS